LLISLATIDSDLSSLHVFEYVVDVGKICLDFLIVFGGEMTVNLHHLNHRLKKNITYADDKRKRKEYNQGFQEKESHVISLYLGLLLIKFS
jgi:hypothetical protein